MGVTISGMTGAGSIRHNNRSFSAANVDQSRTEQNITFCNEDLKQVYHMVFDEALAAYNAKKTKTRDKIPDYSGYQLRLNKALALDFNLGLGYLNADFEKYEVIDGVRVRRGNETKDWCGPINAGVTLVWKLF